MPAKRIIARLDVKGDKLIKGVHLEGWRFLGDPNSHCKDYYLKGVDEVIYIDSVASLYGREMLKKVVKKTTEQVFIPITAGGGVRSVEDAYEILRAGADKVAINSGAIKNPKLITDISKKFGAQCVVLSIQAKKIKDSWLACYDSAREVTNIDVMDWAREGENLGAGEILLTSVDRDGTLKGMDIDLIKMASINLSIPIIASGGFGALSDLNEVLNEGAADAVAIAKALHFNKINIDELKSYAIKNQIL